jgi:hypothetical protein
LTSRFVIQFTTCVADESRVCRWWLLKFPCSTAVGKPTSPTVRDSDRTISLSQRYHFHSFS